MQLQSGDVVIAFIWNKPRPVVVLEVHEDEDACIVVPMTTHKGKPGKLRKELANGNTFALDLARELDGRANFISYLKLRCIREYRLSKIHKKVGSLRTQTWVSIMMYIKLTRKRL